MKKQNNILESMGIIWSLQNLVSYCHFDGNGHFAIYHRVYAKHDFLPIDVWMRFLVCEFFQKITLKHILKHGGLWSVPKMYSAKLWRLKEGIYSGTTFTPTNFVFRPSNFFSTRDKIEQLSYFVLKTSLVVQQNTTMFFFRKCRSLRFLYAQNK